MIQPKSRPILREWIAAGALVLIVAAAYFPVLHNGFIWDDDRYIEQNFNLRTARGLQKIWTDPLHAEPQYYPITHTTLWIEYHLWKLDPLGYHVDNVLLHAASVILLWRILRRLSIPGAWIAAAIWAVHPLQVESVAWATERKNVLSGLFYFLSLWAYLHTKWGRRIWNPDMPGKSGIGWYLLSLLLFFSALLSKSVTSTLPAVILLLGWWKRGKIGLPDVFPIIPMFLAGAAMGCLTGWMEKHIVGAIGPDFDFLTLLDRICIAGGAFWFYLFKFLWPAKLIFIYPHWQIDPLQRPWLLNFPAAAVGLILALWLLRKRIGRGPLVAILFFAGTLFPALGFVNVFPMRYSYVADHFQYIACIGPIALLVGGISRVQIGSLKCVVSALLIASLAVTTNFRSRIFRNRETLWADVLQKNPDSPVAQNNYAVVLRTRGRLEEAKEHFRTAMRLRKDSADWVGLGQCFAIQGDYQTARDFYQKAIENTPDSPEPVFRHLLAGREFQLGTAYQGLANEFPAKSHEYRLDAIAAYQRAIDLYPEYEDPRTNLAAVWMEEGNFPAAMEQCRIVLAQNPDSAPALKNLGKAYFILGQFDSALVEYNQALAVDPTDADTLASIGGILARQGRYDQAIAIFQQAIQIDPHNKIALHNLQEALRQKSRIQP